MHVSLYRKESCKRAYTEAQGRNLFGNKMKLSPVARDGKTILCELHVHCTFVHLHVYMCIMLFMNIEVIYYIRHV